MPLWLKFWIRRASDERRRALTSTAFVSEEKETSARGRLVGIARAVHRRSRLRVSFSRLIGFPLVVVLWCVGNPDLWDRGLVCFWGTFLLWLVYPNLPIAWAQARARITHCQSADRLHESKPSVIWLTPVTATTVFCQAMRCTTLLFCNLLLLHRSVLAWPLLLGQSWQPVNHSAFVVAVFEYDILG